MNVNSPPPLLKPAASFDLGESLTAASSAQQTLANSPYQGLHGVSCSGSSGNIVLSGRVASYFLKQVAQEIVRKAAGARAIINQLVVAESGK